MLSSLTRRTECGMAFCNLDWDKVLPPIEIWEACHKVLRPGGFLLAFGHPRVYHRLGCQIEDAGFEIKDCLCWGYACVDESTEILTVDGWKNIDEMSTQNTAITFNVKNSKIEHMPVLEVLQYDFDGDMINFKNQDTDQLLTPNHRVLKKHMHHSGDRYWEDKNWNFETAENLTPKKGVRLPLAGKYDGFCDLGMDMDQVRLAGWIMTEGWFDKTAPCISQAKQIYVIEIRELLLRMKVTFSEIVRKRPNRKNEHVFRVFAKSWKTLTVSKFLSRDEYKNIPISFLDLFIDKRQELFLTLIKGDGSFCGESWAFYQTGQEFRDRFRILCLGLGYQTLEDKKKMCIHVDKSGTTQIQRKHFFETKKYYKGKVWCIRTDNQTIICKRGRYIFITGNSGNPRPLNIDRAIDKDLGVQGSSEAEPWQGWANNLKNSWEPIMMAQKPLEGRYIDNVQKYNVGGLNIDECRIPYKDEKDKKTLESFGHFAGKDYGDEKYFSANSGGQKQCNIHPDGRWPANMVWLDPLFAEYDHIFMVPKPSRREKRDYNEHLTVKPVELMERLIRLVTPRPSIVGEDVIVLDPFLGSGTTGIAARNLGRKFEGYELDPKSYKTAKKRINGQTKTSKDMFGS